MWYAPWILPTEKSDSETGWKIYTIYEQDTNLYWKKTINIIRRSSLPFSQETDHPQNRIMDVAPETAKWNTQPSKPPLQKQTFQVVRKKPNPYRIMTPCYDNDPQLHYHIFPITTRPKK